MTKHGSTVALAAVLLLLAAGCGGGKLANTGPGTSAAGTPPQLKSIHELQTAFNSASRAPTLVVLVAPT